MVATMATKLLKLRKCSDGYFRTSWVSASGRRFAKSFGANYREAVNRFSHFLAGWKDDHYVRNPDQPAPATIRELWARFKTHAERYYRRPDGTPTGEARNLYDAIRFVLDRYGEVPAKDFGPRMLRQVREDMIDADLSLGVINQRVGKIRHFFKWLVGEELIPQGVWQALLGLTALEAGRTRARVRAPVEPVPEEYVWAVCRAATPTLQAMITLQYLTGMRPDEVCSLRAADLETVGRVWIYRPARHKSQHRGRQRQIPLGPKAQMILRPFLTRELSAFVFNPRETRKWLDQQRATHRGQRVLAPRTQRKVGARYFANSYGQAVRRLCDREGIPRWSPNQLRHNVGKRLRIAFGLDVAQAMLGHSKADMTELYAALDLDRASQAMEEVG